MFLCSTLQFSIFPHESILVICVLSWCSFLCSVLYFWLCHMKCSYAWNVVCLLFANQFAHRACVQRWCNEKGDITCEICNQVMGLSESFFCAFTFFFIVLITCTMKRNPILANLLKDGKYECYTCNSMLVWGCLALNLKL